MNPIPRITAVLLLAPALATTAALAQESRALLDAPLVVVDDQHQFLTLLDFDGDGFQDALGSWWFSTTGNVALPSLYRNDGHGAFQSPLTWNLPLFGPTSPSAFDVDAGRIDIDQDGRDDFWLCYRTPALTKVAVYSSNGAAQPSFHPLLSWTGGAATTPTFADFDGNGFLDRAVVEGSTLKIWTIQLVGTTFSAVLQSTLNLGTTADHVFTTDANDDGTPDVVVNAGTQTFVVPVSLGVAGTPVTLQHGVWDMPMPMAGDVDGDGDVDLVVFDMTGYVVMRKTGPLSYSVAPRVLGGPAAKLADVDADGDLDGICCGGGPSLVNNSSPSTFRIALNDGQGTFAPAFTMAGLGSREIAGAADLDHDGDVDLVAGRCVYYARGPIRARNSRPFVTPTPSADRAYDIDDDGDCDLDAGLGTHLSNQGDGSTIARTTWTVAPPAGRSFVGPGYPGDFDGDGRRDLIVAQFNGSTFEGMRFLRGNGGGGFVDGGPAGAAGQDFRPPVGTGSFGPDGCTVGDSDQDGDLDVFTHTLPGSVERSSLWLNDGSGHFTYSQEIDAIVWYVGDLGGDLAGNFTDLGLAGVIRLGTAVNVWGPGSTGTIGDDVREFADVDGDGVADLLGASAFFPPSASVYIRAPGGTPPWTSALFVDLDVNSSVRVIHAGDFDGDGYLDVLVGCPKWARSAVSLHLWDPITATLRPPILQTVYEEVNGVIDVQSGLVRDFDGDGDADYAAPDWFENTTFDRATGGRSVQSGASTPDAFGMTPTLGARGPFRLGTDVELRLRGAPVGRAGFLFTSSLQDDAVAQVLPAVSPTRSLLRSTTPFTTAGDASIVGSGAFTRPFTVDASRVGRTIRYDALILDRTAPAGSIRTNALEITYGP